MTARPPLIGAALWNSVMRRADNRCECQGACGKRHLDDHRKASRCERINGEHLSKRGEILLIAMPRDPINEGDFATAARLPARRLIAMCPGCHDGVRRIIKRVVRQMPAQDDGLFDSSEFYVAPSSKKQADVGAA